MNVKGVKFVILIAVLFWGIPLYAFDGYGVNMFPFIGNEEEVAERVFEPLEKAGIRWIRLPFRWYVLEPQKGVYDFNKTDRLVSLAQKHNIKVLGLIIGIPKWASVNNDTISPLGNIGDWKMFVRMLVTCYKGKVTHWEIWNEPDIEKFRKTTPEEYVEVLKTTYKAIKDMDPSMKVLSAGLIGKPVYFDKLLSLGMAEYCDIIAFHPYAKTPEKSLKRVKAFLEIMKKHGVDKPLWLTEIGWHAGGLPGRHSIVKDEETKASYLKEAFHLLKPYAEVIFWHKAVANPKRFGLLEIVNDENIRLTPAYNAYKEMTWKDK